MRGAGIKRFGVECIDDAAPHVLVFRVKQQDHEIERGALVIEPVDIAAHHHGLDEALRRAELYARAGADLLFVESPESVEEMQIICKNFDLPLVANMVEGGRTPVLSKQELQELG